MPTFKDYYADPEYRQRHLDRLKEKVTCECGFVTSIVNLKRHKRGSTHAKRMGKIAPTVEEVDPHERKRRLKRMKKRIDTLIKEIEEL